MRQVVMCCYAVKGHFERSEYKILVTLFQRLHNRMNATFMTLYLGTCCPGKEQRTKGSVAFALSIAA